MGLFSTPDGGLFLGIKSDRQYRQASQSGQTYNDFVAQQQAAAQAHRQAVDARLEQTNNPINTFSAVSNKPQEVAQPNPGPQKVEDPAQPIDVPTETVFDESAMAGAFEEGVNTGRSEVEAGVQARIDEAVNSALSGMYTQEALDAKLAEATEAAKAGLFDQATLDAKIAEASAAAVNAAKQNYINNLNSYLDGDDCADIRSAICSEVLIDTPAPDAQPAENQAGQACQAGQA